MVLFNKSSIIERVNEARRMELFCWESKLMENIPPTSDTLLQHIIRAIYQASIWSKASCICTLTFSLNDSTILFKIINACLKTIMMTFNMFATILLKISQRCVYIK